MKAIKIVSAGKAEIQDVAQPELLEDRVLVKVNAVALNPTDWWVAKTSIWQNEAANNSPGSTSTTWQHQAPPLVATSAALSSKSAPSALRATRPATGSLVSHTVPMPTTSTAAALPNTPLSRRVPRTRFLRTFPLRRLPLPVLALSP